MYIICFTILLKPIIPVLDYIVNYDYIRTELCVNREIPIMGCNGKCYLMKQLAAASESEKPVSSDKKHVAPGQTDLFVADINLYDTLFFVPPAIKTQLSRCIDLYQNQDLPAVFHPPAFIS